jgi:hypothetical protein
LTRIVAKGVCDPAGPARLARIAPRMVAVALLLALPACTTPLELGERRYREGDRLAALETWRSVRSDSPYYDSVRKRITEVETEFEQLVVRYKKRARYYERRGRLAESVLNYRLALKLQPEDHPTLDHVQDLVRVLAAERKEAERAFRESFEAQDLAQARVHLEALLALDPFSPEVSTHERQLEGAFEAQLERLLARGRRGFSAGNLTAAERAFRAVLELEPENESAQGYLAYIARIRDEEASQALSAASGRAALAAEPREVTATDAEIRAEGFYRNALAAESNGDPFAAIRFAEAALRENNGHVSARNHLQDLRRRLAPQVPELVRAGREHFQEEDLQSALDQWRRALLIDPGHAETREFMSRAERLLENLERLRSDADDPGAT